MPLEWFITKTKDNGINNILDKLAPRIIQKISSGAIRALCHFFKITH